MALVKSLKTIMQLLHFILPTIIFVVCMKLSAWLRQCHLASLIIYGVSGSLLNMQRSRICCRKERRRLVWFREGCPNSDSTVNIQNAKKCIFLHYDILQKHISVICYRHAVLMIALVAWMMRRVVLRCHPAVLNWLRAVKKMALQE